MKDRLEVNVEFVPRKLNGEIKLGLSDLWVNAHLTDEGLDNLFENIDTNQNG